MTRDFGTFYAMTASALEGGVISVGWIVGGRLFIEGF